MNPIALVTGASGAIGSATSRLFLRRDWTVLGAFHRNPRGVPHGCERVITDFTRPAEAAGRLAAELSALRGDLRVLVHAAGCTEDRSLPRMTPQHWKRVRRTHLDAAFHLARALHPRLSRSSRERSPGHFVLVGSLAGMRGSYGQANYAAAKAGVLGLVMSLAAEWAPRILVNAVRPPLTSSAMTSGIPDHALPQLMDPVLTDRMAPPEQTASLIGTLTRQTNLCGQVLSADHRIHSPWS